MSQVRFCLMTVGRTGSTWLINAIGALPNVALPSANVPSADNELFHFSTKPEYEKLAKRSFTSENDYIEFFFQLNKSSKFAGFKSMPQRHQDYLAFVKRPDICFITLDRKDVGATAASFLNAHKHRTWRRQGGVPPDKLQFESTDRPYVLTNLNYILKSRLALLEIPSPIRLYYEDLCMPTYVCPALDALFEQAVTLAAPKSPTKAQDYVANWEEFWAFVERAWRELVGTLTPKLRAQIGSLAE